jgi:hypothetical protein
MRKARKGSIERNFKLQTSNIRETPSLKFQAPATRLLPLELGV